MVDFIFNYLSKLSPRQLHNIGKSVFVLASFVIAVIAFNNFNDFDLYGSSKNEETLCHEMRLELLTYSDADYKKHLGGFNKRCGRF
jgi:nitrate/TMAO reductase-like tetraheme cytochrome c subunit